MPFAHLEVIQFWINSNRKNYGEHGIFFFYLSYTGPSFILHFPCFFFVLLVLAGLFGLGLEASNIFYCFYFFLIFMIWLETSFFPTLCVVEYMKHVVASTWLGIHQKVRPILLTFLVSVFRSNYGPWGQFPHFITEFYQDFRHRFAVFRTHQ